MKNPSSIQSNVNVYNKKEKKTSENCRMIDTMIHMKIIVLKSISLDYGMDWNNKYRMSLPSDDDESVYIAYQHVFYFVLLLSMRYGCDDDRVRGGSGKVIVRGGSGKVIDGLNLHIQI